LNPTSYYTEDSFVTGAFGGIRNVREIDGRTIGDGKLGPVTGRLQDLYE
jgi:branched-chain amino acid aminotransferase